MLRQTDIFIKEASYNTRSTLQSDFLYGENQLWFNSITFVDSSIIKRLLFNINYERDMLLLNINLKTIQINLQDYKHLIDYQYSEGNYKLFKLFKFNKLHKLLADNVPLEFSGIPKDFLSETSVSTITFAINKDGYFGFIIGTDETSISPNVKNIYVKSQKFIKKKNIIIYYLSMYYPLLIKGGFYMLRNLLSNTGLVLGSIFPYFKEDEPTNFLICNGQSCIGYEIEDIGITKVPDLRGKFTRMIGGNSLGMGIEQGDAIRNIKGSFGMDGYASTYQYGTSPIDGGLCVGPFVYVSNYSVSDYSVQMASGKSKDTLVRFDASKVVPTAVENRPINMAFNYIIYVGRKKKLMSF